jgi:NADH-quinone oxidoreductase subunit N
VLCGLDRKREASLESSLKYFLLGAFASGFFIYGAALVYGMAGHLNYVAIAEYFNSLSEDASPVMLIGLALVGAGFAFKLAFVPFHAWTPDVYQGAPTPITGFMAVGVKLSMFAAAIRLVVEALPTPDANLWREALVVFAILSMVVGNLLALHQMSIKRLLAYSAIAHTGYLAVGLAAGSQQAAGSILVYMTAYTLAGLGVFALVGYLAPDGQDDIYLDEMHDLWSRAPATSLALTILLLSMGGLPLTAGFIGKLMVFTDAWREGLTGLVIIAVLNSVVSFYYYLRIVIVMYMQEKASGAVELKLMPMAPTFIITGIVCVGLTLILGIAPRFLLEVVELCRLGG